MGFMRAFFVDSLKMTTAKNVLASLLCQLERVSPLQESLRIAYAENVLWTPVIERLSTDCRQQIEKELVRVERFDDSEILDEPINFLRNLETLRYNYDMLFNSMDLTHWLFYSIRINQIPLMELLCVSGLVDCNYALREACSNNKINAVRWLLAHKELPIDQFEDAFIAAYNSWCFSPENPPDILSLLIRDGRFDPTIRDCELLFLAIDRRDSELLELLLNSCDASGKLLFDPTIQDYRAFKLAIWRRNLAAIKLLLKRVQLSEEQAGDLIKETALIIDYEDPFFDIFAHLTLHVAKAI